MQHETMAGSTVDRCNECGSLWFDAEELDRWWNELYPAEARLPEACVPRRGLSGRTCPRCEGLLEAAGWTGVVLDRCPGCRGLLVEPHDLRELRAEGIPARANSFEADFAAAMVNAGWWLLAARAFANLAIRFLR